MVYSAGKDFKGENMQDKWTVEFDPNKIISIKHKLNISYDGNNVLRFVLTANGAPAEVKETRGQLEKRLLELQILREKRLLSPVLQEEEKRLKAEVKNLVDEYSIPAGEHTNFGDYLRDNFLNKENQFQLATYAVERISPMYSADRCEFYYEYNGQMPVGRVVDDLINYLERAEKDGGLGGVCLERKAVKELQADSRVAQIPARQGITPPKDWITRAAAEASPETVVDEALRAHLPEEAARKEAVASVLAALREKGMLGGRAVP